MRRVYQTRKGADPDAPRTSQGNCFPAALASLLDMELKDLPDFDDDSPNWIGPFETFLADRGQAMNWLLVRHQFDHSNGWLGPMYAPQGMSLANGPSPRGDWNHVVVAEDGIEVHDPAGPGDSVPYFVDYMVIRPDGGATIDVVELPEDRWVPEDARLSHPATPDATDPIADKR